jgi:hypothetical protein
MSLHVAVLLCANFRGIILFGKTANPLFALSAAFCIVYLVVGTLEAVLVIAPSSYAFYTALLLCSLCVEKTEPEFSIQTMRNVEKTAEHAVLRGSTNRSSSQPYDICSKRIGELK